jgi:hypothetical protein
LPAAFDFDANDRCVVDGDPIELPTIAISLVG